MGPQLDIERLSLANAAGIEPQFQDALKEIVQVCTAPEDFETAKGQLKFEVNVKLKIEVDPRSGETWVEGNVTNKVPKRKARRQIGRLADQKLQVHVEPLPEERLIPFTGGKHN